MRDLIGTDIGNISGGTSGLAYRDDGAILLTIEEGASNGGLYFNDIFFHGGLLIVL